MNKESPAITIIVPIYNAEKTLHRCINSITTQTFRDWECILVDDGSKDASSRICDEYAQQDDRFIVIHKDNGGVSSARNLGIEKANATWITFVDSDDWIEPSFIHSMNNEFDLCIHNWRPFEHELHYNDIEAGKIEFPKDLEMTRERYGNNHVLSVPWAKYFKRSIIKEHNIEFNPKYKIGEDALFVLEYMTFCKRIYIPTEGGHYMYLPNFNWKSKYKLTKETSIEYLNQYYSLHKRSRIRSSIHIYNKIRFYSRITENNDSISKRTLWFCNPIIAEILFDIRKELGFKNRLFCECIYLISKFIKQ